MQNYMGSREISTTGWRKLHLSFYERNNVVEVAKDLIGKILATTFDDKLTAGRIVETEAYNGAIDKASHAYNYRRTKRTEVMYAHGGVAYVYLCYGIHQMFNVVTNVKDTPAAVLIRGLDPLIGVETMLQRSDKTKQGFDLTRGPGNVAKALGIFTKHTAHSLSSDDLFIAEDDFSYNANEIVATKRIGVDYSGEDALLPYRFIVKGNKNVSSKRDVW